MKAIFALSLALIMNLAFAENFDFKVVKLEPAKSFYRDSPPNADIGAEIQTFLAASDIYKIRRDQWVFLIIERDTQKMKGIGMEFQDGDNIKHIPANKIFVRPGGRYLEFTTRKNSSQMEIQKQMKKYLIDNKLKVRGKEIYHLLPAIKVKDDDITQTFLPIE